MTEDENTLPVADSLDPLLKRAHELHGGGLDWDRALGEATLEARIRAWPSGWGDKLRILIYGDFEPPATELAVASLGITVSPEKLENTAITGARCVLGADVDIQDKSVGALIEASRRLNVLLGAWTLVTWGNSACGWWSYVTHTSAGGIVGTFGADDLNSTIRGILQLPPPVQAKVDAALYWIREPRNLLHQHYRSDLLRTYAAHWNAFECLVEAVNLIWPREQVSRGNKQALVDEFVALHGGRLTAEDVEKCYREIINPGLTARAKHALGVCFPADRFPGLATKYAFECFEVQSKRDRLYQIRNDINHGNVDAENPEELLRVDSRHAILWTIVWQMMARLVPFAAPAASTIDVLKQ